jgi:predicted ATP-grasp superfamily ATP-dependent carboligase
VREARPGERRRPGEFLQARLDGAAGSIAFVAAGGEARLLGATTLLDTTGPDAGIAALAAPPFRYAGNIAGPMDAMLPPEALRLLERAASRITARFELRGLNGIDYVLTDRGPVVLEVNPRFTASMEILEECLGESFIDRHLEALDGARPPGAPPASVSAAPAWRAKGILYADRALVAPDPDLLVPLGARDRPREGERFEPGRPLCTLVVAGTGASDCRRRLGDRAREARALFLAAAGPQHRP